MTGITISQSLRYALRALRRNSTTTVLVVLSLAIAIAASAVVYSAIETVLRLIPANERGRLVYLASTNAQRRPARVGVSIPDFIDWSAQNTTFEALTAFTFDTFNLTGLEIPVRVSAARVSANLPSVWGFDPVPGRTFRGNEDRPGAERVVLLSSRFWEQQFSGNPGVLGQVLLLDGEPHTVIGVAPPEVNVGIFRQVQVIVPLVLDATRAPRDQRQLFVTGVLKAGVTREQGAADLEGIARRLQSEYPRTNAGTNAVVRPLLELVGETTSFVILLLSLVAALVLIIACANVSNVMLAYWTARRREFAIRAALGAGRFQQIKELMLESFVLSALAGATGLLFATWGLSITRTVAGGDLLVFNEMAVNGRVLLFGVLVAFAAPFGFALLPAVRSLTHSPQELNDGSRSGTAAHGGRLRQILVVSQVALAFILVIEIALLARTVSRLGDLEKGFDPTNVLTLRVELPSAEYVEARQVRDFIDALLVGIERLPGISSAAAVSRLPIADREQSLQFVIEGQLLLAPEALPRAARAVITPHYLRTMRIPLIRGRDLVRADSAEAPRVGVVSQEMARRYWPDSDPIGKRIQFMPAASAQDWIEIVGIVGDVRNSDADAGVLPYVYVPASQQPERTMAIVLRTEGPDPAALTSAIRTQVAQLDKDLPIYGVATMDQVLFADLGSNYLLVGMLAAVALIAVGLAAAGIFGLIAYSVSQRNREIGIRIALGAQPQAVLRMMLRQATTAVGVGGLLGITGGFALVYLTASAIGEVDPHDPVAYTSVLVFLAGVAFLASYLPARRALRVDPMVVLRTE
ncbi:MAG TPA: ABC transporter permease [Vicinamibacterales bacterium]|nr:ABC transporter permease [Vicinamibacterales bacterium]